MDKNTIFGMLLMGLVLFGFMYCNRPDPNAQQQDAAEQAAGNTAAADNQATAPAATMLTDTYRQTLANEVRQYGEAGVEPGTFNLNTSSVNLTVGADSILDGTVNVAGKSVSIDRAFSAGDTTVTLAQRDAVAKILESTFEARRAFGPMAKFMDAVPGAPITIKNDKIAVTFNPMGGMISDVVLLQYKTEVGEEPADIHLVSPETSAYGFTFTTANQTLQTKDLVFTPSVNADSTSVTMTLAVDKNTEMAFVYELLPEEYIVRMSVVQKNMQTVIPANRTTADFNWWYKMMRNEKGRTFEEQKSAIYYKMVDDNPEDMSANASDSESLKGAIKWVAFKNQFFSAVIIPQSSFTTADLHSEPIKDSPSELKALDMKATLDFSSVKDQPFACDFYFGPNSYPGLGDVDDILAAQDGDESLKLNKLVPLGWGIFGWINRFVIIPVFNFLGSFGWNYGIIILLLTIFIKIILFPLTYKSYMSQARMRCLQPEIKEINEKYPNKEDALKRQQETMKLYSRAGASPFSGCLPMLLQMPILIAMFSFFPSAIELRGQSFLWVHDLSAPDYICTLPFTIPFYGNKVSLFCLLMTVTNIIYTRQMSQSQMNAAGGPNMKWMTYLMPIMFLFFFNDYAAGLSYYYFLSLLITIGQTLLFRQFIDEKKVRDQMLANAKKPRKKKGFMARLEEAQKRQEAMMREQAKRNRR